MPPKRKSGNGTETSKKKLRRRSRPEFAATVRRAHVVDANPRQETSPDMLGRVLGALSLEDFEAGGVRVTHAVPGRLGPHVAAHDVIRIATGTTQHNASQQWAKLKRDHAETISGTDSFRFAGQRGPGTDLVNLQTALQIIMLLPGKAAAAMRLKASVLLVRFLGGDLSLVAEIYDMNALQRHLKEHWPEHPLARFGEAAAATSDSSAPTGAGDHELPGPAATTPPVPAEVVQQISELTTRTICHTIVDVFVAKFDELLRRMAADHATWQAEMLRKVDVTLSELPGGPARLGYGTADADIIDVEAPAPAPAEDLRGRAPVKVGQFMHEQWCESWAEAGINVKSYLLQFSMLLKAKTTQTAGR